MKLGFLLGNTNPEIDRRGVGDEFEERQTKGRLKGGWRKLKKMEGGHVK